jgi:hypothetical protein
MTIMNFQLMHVAIIFQSLSKQSISLFIRMIFSRSVNLNSRIQTNIVIIISHAKVIAILYLEL